MRITAKPQKLNFVRLNNENLGEKGLNCTDNNAIDKYKANNIMHFFILGWNIFQFTYMHLMKQTCVSWDRISFVSVIYSKAHV